MIIDLVQCLATLRIVAIVAGFLWVFGAETAYAQCRADDLSGCLPDLSGVSPNSRRSVDPASGVQTWSVSYALPGFFAYASRSTAKNDGESKNTVYTRSPAYHVRELGKQSKRSVALGAKGTFERNAVSYRYQMFDFGEFSGGCASAVGRSGEMKGWGWRTGISVLTCHADGMTQHRLFAVIDELRP